MTQEAGKASGSHVALKSVKMQFNVPEKNEL